MINYLFAVALLISQITPAVESAAQKGMLPTFWQPICELSEELDTKPHKAIAALQAATKKIERMHRANLRTQIYATANVGTKEGKAARLASIYYAGKLQEGLAQLNTATAQNSVEGAAAATYLKGHLDEYLTLWAHVKQDATEACLLTTGGGGAAAVAADTLGGVQCKRRLAKPSSSSQNPEAMTQAGFPKLVKAITADAQQHSAGKCPLSSGHSANGLGDTGKVSTTFKVLDGYLSIPDSNSPVTVANLEALSNNHKPATQPGTQPGKQTTEQQQQTAVLSATRQATSKITA
uniref:Variant surface glycoprotein 1795 n=1 Tax=Trypanosoma brucei TaxID=5691 RepID=M4SXA7_9TRYP|nr:variant surface glycoprotein 1795 [Trypanosoma brucei]